MGVGEVGVGRQEERKHPFLKSLTHADGKASIWFVNYAYYLTVPLT